MRERRTAARRPGSGATLACAALLMSAAGAAHADDLLGFSFGGTYGKATVDASTGLVSGFGMINFDRGLGSGAVVLSRD